MISKVNDFNNPKRLNMNRGSTIQLFSKVENKISQRVSKQASTRSRIHGKRANDIAFQPTFRRVLPNNFNDFSALRDDNS